jgi:hypothetical protein
MRHTCYKHPKLTDPNRDYRRSFRAQNKPVQTSLLSACFVFHTSPITSNKRISWYKDVSESILSSKRIVFIQFSFNCLGPGARLKKTRISRLNQEELSTYAAELHKTEYITRNTQAITATLTHYDNPVTLIHSQAKYRLRD